MDETINGDSFTDDQIQDWQEQAREGLDVDGLSRRGRPRLGKAGESPVIRQLRIGHPRMFVQNGSHVQAEPVDPPPEPHLLMYGRIAGYKGINVAVDAFRLASTAMPNLKMTVAGRRPLADMVEASGVGGLTVINRYILSEEADDLIRQVTLVLLPYRDATQSGVGANAVDTGIPCFVTDVGALPELVLPGVPQLVLESGASSDELASAILTFAGHGRDLREAVQENARLQFAWPVAATRLPTELTRTGMSGWL